ncbi:hypothetical protein, partial [Thiolapillus sp.]
KGNAASPAYRLYASEACGRYSHKDQCTRSAKGRRIKRYASQACLRPRDRFWDIPVPKIDSAFDNLFVPQPSWSPSTTQQLRKLVAAPYLAPNDWTPRSEAYFVFPLAQGTPGKQCGLAATGVYQPSLRSPWLAAVEFSLHALAYNLSRAVALFSSSTGRYLVFFRILTRLRRIPRVTRSLFNKIHLAPIPRFLEGMGAS